MTARTLDSMLQDLTSVWVEVWLNNDGDIWHCCSYGCEDCTSGGLSYAGPTARAAVEAALDGVRKGDVTLGG